MGRDRSWPDATVVSMQVLIDSAISQTLSMSLHPVMEATQGHRDIRQPLSAWESSVSSAAGMGGGGAISMILAVRRSITPEPEAEDLYRTLGIAAQIIRPQYAWTNNHSD
jgi:hypothetical protein